MCIMCIMLVHSHRVMQHNYVIASVSIRFQRDRGIYVKICLMGFRVWWTLLQLTVRIRAKRLGYELPRVN